MRNQDNKFPLRAMTGSIVRLMIVMLLVALSGWKIGAVQQRDSEVRAHIIRNIGMIRYYDEVLTMSARLAASADAAQYEARYLRAAPKLDKLISDTSKLADDSDATRLITSTNEANLKLVAMEEHSFDLVHAGRSADAYSLLNSPEYLEQKQLYKAGFTDALNRFKIVVDSGQRRSQMYRIVALVLALVGVVVELLIWVQLVSVLRRWYAEFQDNRAELQAAHSSLVSTHLRTKLVLDTIGDAVIGVAVSGEPLFANPIAQDTLGFDDESHDCSVHDMIHPNLDHSCSYENCDLLAGLSRSEPSRGETMLRLPNGRSIDISYSISPIHEGEDAQAEDGRFSHVLVFCDITERREVERQKSEFLSIVSHELRTPLTSMRGSFGLIAAGAAGDLNERMKTLVNIGISNSDRLIRLINDILDIERSDSIPIDRSAQNARDVLAESVSTMEGLASQFGVRLTVDKVDTEITVWADPDRLVQTLINLVSNAIKFSEPDSSVEASVVPLIGYDMAVFSVTDHGRGIPEEHLGRIFERFAQVDAADTRQHGGTGLGLAICKQIVEGHDGKIWVESKVGMGSTFRFTIPLSSAKMNMKPATSSQTDPIIGETISAA